MSKEPLQYEHKQLFQAALHNRELFLLMKQPPSQTYLSFKHNLLEDSEPFVVSQTLEAPLDTSFLSMWLENEWFQNWQINK